MAEFSQRLKRVLKHLTTTGRAARRAFPAASLSAIHDAISEGELRHRAQLKLIIEPSLDLADVLDGDTARGRGHELFARYRIWDTEENCGVLIYINLADHKVEIITDRAVGRIVPQTDWEAACKLMTQGYARRNFHDSTLAGVAHVNALLEKHFPASGENDARTNEVSDRPVIL